MAIKQHNESGFTVFTTHEGIVVGEADFQYAELGVPCDERGVPDRVGPLALWAIRNGMSQALLDTGAGKERTKRTEAFLAKVLRFRRGIVPSEGGSRGPALSELERELRAVVEAFLRKRGEKATVAKEKAMDPAGLAEEIADALAAARGAPETAHALREKLLNQWSTAAQARLDELNTLPTDL